MNSTLSNLAAPSEDIYREFANLVFPKKMSFYEILQCPLDASHDQLKACYKKLVLYHHPDKSNHKNSALFHLVQEAWDVLSDPQKRREYDNAMKLLYSEPPNGMISDTVKIEEMDSDCEGEYWRCQCGGTYYVSEDMKKLLRAPQAIYIPCLFCSLTLKVVQ